MYSNQIVYISGYIYGHGWASFLCEVSLGKYFITQLSLQRQQKLLTVASLEKQVVVI